MRQFLFFAALVVREALSQLQNVCPSGWQAVETSPKCFAATADHTNWIDAPATCDALGYNAILASFTTEAEAQIVTQGCGNQIPTSRAFWIGLNDNNQESVTRTRSAGSAAARTTGWEWYDEADTAYIFSEAGQGLWQSSQPNNYFGENCVIVKAATRTLDDVACASLNFPSCCSMIPPSSSPTPTSSVSASLTPSISTSPSITPSSTPSSSASPSSSSSSSVSSSGSPSESTSPSITPSKSLSSSVTPSESISSSITPSKSLSSSVTPSESISSSITPSKSLSSSVTPTESISPSQSSSSSASSTRTPSFTTSTSPSRSATMSNSQTPSETSSTSISPSNSPSESSSISPGFVPTSSITPTNTPTSSLTPSETPSYDSPPEYNCMDHPGLSITGRSIRLPALASKHPFGTRDKKVDAILLPVKDLIDWLLTSPVPEINLQAMSAVEELYMEVFHKHAKIQTPTLKAAVPPVEQPTEINIHDITLNEVRAYQDL